MTPETKREAKQRRAVQRHDFLLTFFDNDPRYQVIEKNGFILIRQWNKGIDRWEVAIYTKENYQKAKSFLERQQLTKPML